ncbi:FadR/GntR family transcriptional regulator [Gilvimarinus sp. SDUM040013]|uniref:FadR/GntR family transcriptional regulator n=1 Tax=Gilvimarinus gilvus TaxID=3058038 RepID=A0ABU4S3Y1_9GAMM|nr:FadR/GntR family transcriptional regulator [Gilvimarinus sp. SDUM040013]MDO3385904.1 FadR/GntR family transcriptional regulator [Gilvimarinus sp. SDUM040013]MDX6850593.1 FadR/GntR family transcriptional regulator [Gilvimarinus sp. SDUM040013]
MSDSTNGGNRRTYRKVAQKMLAALDSGEFPAGARLPPERELSERYGVSRPTIREAIIALEVMGRVDVQTGSGVYALKSFNTNSNNPREYSPFEVTEARVLVESEVAALAASTMSNEELEELQAALEDMISENETGNLTSEVADRRFHMVIANSTQNRPLISMIQHLWDIQANLPEIKTAHQSICKTDGATRINEHRAILEALKAKDPHAARVSMRNHFSRSLDALHATTEQRAVEEIQKQLTERRERFSLNRIQYMAD